MKKYLILQFLIHLLCLGFAKSMRVFATEGLNKELRCSYLSQRILWFKDDMGLSEVITIFDHVRPIEFRDRLSITGNHTNGEYHLAIATVNKTDEGVYGCSVAGVPDQISINLTVVGNVGLTRVFGIKGFNIELKCAFLSQTILWVKDGRGLSEVKAIFDHVRPVEFRDRLSITGNNANGEYHLTISTVKETDEGVYGCSVAGIPDQTSIIMTVVDGPTNVNILDKTQNKLVGTEDKDLIITCTAVSEDPSPDMVLQIRNQNFTRSGTKTIQHTIQRIDRTYDRSTVTCLAGYQRYNDFNVKDSATIYLKLLLSTPTFSPDSVVGENTKPLVVTCTSTGGRPEPTERQWNIDNTDVTSSSDISSSYISGSDTYTVTSKLTYSVSRHDNGKTVSCGFKNDAGGSYISSTRVMNITYAPSVSVDNKILSVNDTSRELKCVADGNPSDYTYSKWQHKSKFGTVIRYLDGNSTLTLPPVTEETRYQDTGEYVCTVSNGIVGTNGNNNQRASGYVTSQAPPVFLKREIQTVSGHINKDVSLVVDVYSEPKYTSLTWMKDTSYITPSVKYSMADDTALFTDTFHGTVVEVDGYKITLTIHDLQIEDFVNYTLRLGNGVGQEVEHFVLLLSASQPDIPTKLTAICTKDSTITLQWFPAFNGGHEQTFFIEYRITGTFEWRMATFPKTLQGPDDELQTYTLSELIESTDYEVRMYAENIFNKSETTDVVRASTIGTCKAECFALLGIAVGVSAIALTSLITNGILVRKLLNYKKISQRNQASADRKSQTENYYSMTDDPSNKDERLSSNTQKYEDLGTKDKPNAYEIVRQTKSEKEEKVIYANKNPQELNDKNNLYEEFGQNIGSNNKLYSNTTI